MSARERDDRPVRGWAVLAAVALVLLPEVGAACPVCMGGQEEDVRVAFILTTAFLTFFPLLMVGGVIFWYVRRALQREREYEALRAAEADEAGTGDTKGADAERPQRPALARV